MDMKTIDKLRVIIKVTLRLRWLLKSLIDQNLIIINHKTNDNFRNHIIFWVT